MTIKELRIGNYVLYNDEIIDIHNIIGDYNGVNIHMDYMDYINVSDLKPIPITEKILLKCGFEECNFTENHYNTKGMRIWKCNDMFLCDKNGVVIKHLHQLQNLYFVLTNQELNYDINR